MGIHVLHVIPFPFYRQFPSEKDIAKSQATDDDIVPVEWVPVSFASPSNSSRFEGAKSLTDKNAV